MSTMQYVFLICTDPSPETVPVANTVATPNTDPEMDIQSWADEVIRRGRWITGDPVAPASEAVSVSVRDGETLRTDGPFAEAHELMAGFDLVECADLDEAIDLARKHPMARYGAVEIRPVLPTFPSAEA
jgi:hypothetical protein